MTRANRKLKRMGRAIKPDSFAFLQWAEFKNRTQEAVSRIFSRIIRLHSQCMKKKLSDRKNNHKNNNNNNSQEMHSIE